MKHRTALVTALSIAGVLLAGISALGVNLGILASTESGGIGSATPTIATTGLAPAGQGDPEVTTTSEPAELLAYEVEAVGVVTLERGVGGIRVSSVDAPGWAWDVSSDDTEIVVEFTSGSSIIVFDARLVGDQIEVTVADRTATYSDDDSRDDEDHEDQDDENEDENEEDEDGDEEEDHERDDD